MLATNFAELTGFMRLSPDSPKPEIQYEFVIVLALDHGRKIYCQARHVVSRAAAAPAEPRHRQAGLARLSDATR